MRCFNKLYIFFAIATFPQIINAQPLTDSTGWKTVAVAPELASGGFHQWLWGRNRRPEWTTPVQMRVFWLDTSFGGLTPYQEGGGNETRSLRLRNKNGKEYSLRSVNKNRSAVIPPEARGTFVEDIVKDGVSMSHPFGALAVAGMQQAAGLYHTLPIVVYVPAQPLLDTFGTKKYTNDVFLFEQRPDGDWSDAPNLGSFKEFESTEDVIKKILKDNHHSADQKQFAKARLFDMLISDWDRHEDNFRWGVKKKDESTIYIPIARDRDQAFYTHKGVLVDRIIPAAGLGYMQNFDYKIKNVTVLNTSSRFIDRFFTNELSLDDWVNEAVMLKMALTDTVIAASVRQLPPEIFEISGTELIEKLKSRRNDLPKYAVEYYRSIAKEVEITGTKDREYFEVKGLDAGKTMVAIYRLDKSGKKENTPYYQRIFKSGETKEIRLFSIDDDDIYDVQNRSDNITVRIIGGDGKDSIAQSGKSVKVYDDHNNAVSGPAVKMHTYSDADTTRPKFIYKWFTPDKSGFSPAISYSNSDRVYVGINYRNRKYKWNKTPFASEHVFGVNYSISQNAFNFTWAALYPKLVGQWDLALAAEYDFIRWTNFYGIGNESKMLLKNPAYHRLRSREWTAGAALVRNFGNNRVRIGAYYHVVRNLQDSGQYVALIEHSLNPDLYEPNRYAGVQLQYSYVSVNDSIVPTKGISLITTGSWANNFTQKEFFHRYELAVHTYLPITRQISLAVRAGGAHIVNDDVLNTGQQYQHAILGGGRSLRGFRRERFWGQTSYYNQNELRFITDLRTGLVNGKIGFFGFFDNGRVWMPGEESSKIHIGYGPGLLLAPFKKIAATVTYSFSEEIRLIQVRVDSRL